MDKKEQLKSLKTKQKVFLILGIVFVVAFFIYSIIEFIHGYQFGYQLATEKGAEYVYTHFQEVIEAYYRDGGAVLTVLSVLFSLLFDAGIVFIILSFALFGRKAKRLDKEILDEELKDVKKL